MLVDEVTIHVRGGNGGDGKKSFLREKFRPRGGPDGGNGGTGGSVYFQGTSDLTALKRFRFQKEFTAQSGEPGRANNQYGKAGQDLTLLLPLGTIVTDLDTQEKFEIIDLNQKLLIATGGRGGRGNYSFRNSKDQAPTRADSGIPGQARRLFLELQLIAHVGLIGLPNVGKSSLLNHLTQANAPVANYPFTTLFPNLGVMDNLILADIPGLIEGASSGRGLGIKFLRHIRRTKILVHCISCESANPVADYHTVRNELKQFDAHLAGKPEIILFTKSDLAVPPKNFRRKYFTCSIYDPASLAQVRQQILSSIRQLQP